MREFDQAEMVEMLDELIMNSSRRFLGKPTRFKLYPSHSDRGAFERVMTGGNPSDHRLDLAFRFFSVAARDWLSTGGESAQSASLDQRANALGATIQDRLSLVSIDLSGNDDAQLIFETLNDRGTPLLKADLVKNWVFREGAQLNADVDDWAVRLSDEFDQPWWREEVQQGRLMRSRIDIFLQYWLTMKSCAEVRSDDTFRAFVRQSKPFMADRDFATSYLESLRSDADIFRRFAELGSDTPEGSFYRRVIERLELSVTTPIFLWLLSETTKVPADQRSLGLAALESWSVRRMLMRMTTKDVNKFAVVLLRALAKAPVNQAGSVLRRVLSEQTAVSRVWPTDAELQDDLSDAKVYGNIRQDRLRLVLGTVEQSLRDESAMHESITLPERLQIEHVMPQGWRAYWDEGLDPEAAVKRDRRVHSIGNLTLVTQALNGSLSNRPWSDAMAQGLDKGGHPGEGKRTLLNQFSLLVLNKELLDDHPDRWTEDDIRARSLAMAKRICSIWPGPDLEARPSITPALSGREGRGRDDLWDASSVQALADDCSGAIGAVLDQLAAIAPEGWSTVEFQSVGIASPHSALGGLSAKLAAKFPGLPNVVAFEKRSGQWFWSVSTDFAKRWAAARSR